MVDPTRPIDNAVPAQETGPARVQRTNPTADVTSGQSRDASSPANVADSVGEARQLMETALNEVRRADQARVAELKEAIAEGRYRVDPADVAKRMITDALGE